MTAERYFGSPEDGKCNIISAKKPDEKIGSGIAAEGEASGAAAGAFENDIEESYQLGLLEYVNGIHSRDRAEPFGDAPGSGFNDGEEKTLAGSFFDEINADIIERFRILLAADVADDEALRYIFSKERIELYGKG
jgi:hypothetical protein